MMDCKFVEKVLYLVSHYELDVFWDTSIQFFVLCNDLFLWGMADAVPITPDNYDALESACLEASDEGGELFCCRMRKTRPQGAYYKTINPRNWGLFDACGPERWVGFGNPEPHPGEMK